MRYVANSVLPFQDFVRRTWIDFFPKVILRPSLSFYAHSLRMCVYEWLMLGFFCVCAMPTSAAVSAAVSDIICPFLNLSRVSASASPSVSVSVVSLHFGLCPWKLLCPCLVWVSSCGYKHLKRRDTHTATLQYTATRCNTQQRMLSYLCTPNMSLKTRNGHTATRCCTPHHTASHYTRNLKRRDGHAFGFTQLKECLKWCLDLGIHVVTVSHTATHCNTLQHTATHRNTLHHTTEHVRFKSVWSGVWISASTSSTWVTLRHTATHCNIQQHPAAHCRTRALQECPKFFLDLGIHVLPVSRPATQVLQPTATHCITLQHPAAHCRTCAFPGCLMFYPWVALQHTAATHCNTLQHTATPCSTLQNMRASRVSGVGFRFRHQCGNHESPCITLQHTITHRNTLQHNAAHMRWKRVSRGVWSSAIIHMGWLRLVGSLKL